MARVAALRTALAVLLAGVMTSAASLSAQPLPPAPPDEARSVQGWLVEHRAEEDGGRIVRTSRAGNGLAIEYHVAFWRGNAGPYSGASARRRGRLCGSDSWRRDPGGNVWGAEADVAAASLDVRARLAALLVQCGSRPGQVDAALAGFEPAYRLASAWAETARLATLAEADAIAKHGREANGREDQPHASGPD